MVNKGIRVISHLRVLALLEQRHIHSVVASWKEILREVCIAVILTVILRKDKKRGGGGEEEKVAEEEEDRL